jgi:hypothetical protein
MLKVAKISFTLRLDAVHYDFRMKFGSSFCRVTGVSSLNLARRLSEAGGLFFVRFENVSARSC